MYERTYENVLADIKKHPERHRHCNYDELRSCCMINGAIDLGVMDAHAGIIPGRGSNCDVIGSRCGCGATH